jgi:biotin operon repressor
VVYKNVSSFFFLGEELRISSLAVEKKIKQDEGMVFQKKTSKIY